MFLKLLMEAYAEYCEERPSFVWDTWVGLVADFRIDEMIEQGRCLYRKGLADSGVMKFSELESSCKGSPEASPPNVQDYGLIDDTVAEMREWADHWDESPEDEETDWLGGDDDEMEWVPPDRQPLGTYVRESPKIGRNEPCPCGSGKKFKKCCGAA